MDNHSKSESYAVSNIGIIYPWSFTRAANGSGNFTVFIKSNIDRSIYEDPAHVGFDDKMYFDWDIRDKSKRISLAVMENNTIHKGNRHYNA